MKALQFNYEYKFHILYGFVIKIRTSQFSLLFPLHIYSQQYPIPYRFTYPVSHYLCIKTTKFIGVSVFCSLRTRRINPWEVVRPFTSPFKKYRSISTVHSANVKAAIKLKWVLYETSNNSWAVLLFSMFVGCSAVKTHVNGPLLTETRRHHLIIYNWLINFQQNCM